MQVVVNQILIGLIALVGCVVGGTLLLPSLATDELREVLADIIQSCGYSISGYASRIFPPEQVNCQVLLLRTHTYWHLTLSTLYIAYVCSTHSLCIRHAEVPASSPQAQSCMLNSLASRKQNPLSAQPSDM